MLRRNEVDRILDCMEVQNINPSYIKLRVYHGGRYLDECQRQGEGDLIGEVRDFLFLSEERGYKQLRFDLTIK